MRDDVDVLHRAALIARFVRRAEDPRALLSALLARFRGDASASDTASLCLELARATETCEADLRAALRESATNRSLNRPSEVGVEPSAEGTELMAWIHEHRTSGVVISEGRASFRIDTREVELYSSVDSFDPFSEAERTFLVDYPLSAPLVFRATTSLSFGEICERIADAYAEIYRDPKKFGVYGHDRCDLVIEQLVWFPEREIVHPEMGS